MKGSGVATDNQEEEPKSQQADTDDPAGRRRVKRCLKVAGAWGRRAALPSFAQHLDITLSQLGVEVASVHQGAALVWSDVAKAKGMPELVGQCDGALAGVGQVAIDDDLTGLVAVVAVDKGRSLLEAHRKARGVRGGVVLAARVSNVKGGGFVPHGHRALDRVALAGPKLVGRLDDQRLARIVSDVEDRVAFRGATTGDGQRENNQEEASPRDTCR